jgi:large subunit ribosomal protein L9
MGKKTKIILTSTTKSLGQRGNSKEVANGFFRNFLSRNRMAVVYSDKITQEYLKKNTFEKKTDYAVLEGKCLYFERKSSGVGMLYGSVSKKDIIDEIKRVYNVNVEKNQIVQNNPMKKIGLYDIEIHEENMYVSIGNTMDEAMSLMLNKGKVSEVTEEEKSVTHKTFTKESEDLSEKNGETSEL